VTLYECEIRHARTAPLRNVFRYRGYLWLVDVDHLPRIPLLAVFRGRDHLGDPRAASGRTSTASWPRTTSAGPARSRC
jgi:hypothetical protein